MSERPAASRLKFILPQVPTWVDQPPEGDGWIHEVKFDGYRTQIIVENGTARTYTRNGLNWSTKFWPIGLAAQALPCKSAIVDGEVIAAGGDNGVSDFAAVARAIRSEPSALSFVAFDLLHLDGKDADRAPPVAGRAGERQPENSLQRELRGRRGGDLPCGRGHGAGGDGFEARADSRYRSGPSKAWLKAKCFVESDFELLGVVRDPGQAAQALMATPDRKYVGSAIIALKGEMRDRLWERVQAKPDRAPKGMKKAGAQWVQPGLVGRVRFPAGRGRSAACHADRCARGLKSVALFQLSRVGSELLL